MSASRTGRGRGQSAYVRLCRSLETAGARIGVRGRSELAQQSRRKDAEGAKALESALQLSGLEISPECVLAASKTAGILSAIFLASATAILWHAEADEFIPPALFLAAAVPYLLRGAVLAHPRGVAAKRAATVLKGSTAAVNLMIMSLRHEPSISRAIRFASRRPGEFSKELAMCSWKVLMGTQSSFEEALHSLGSRWERYSGELKTAMNAMVTASCERTEDGKRRALERANGAVIGGARRRIEEYALSLSTPSMILFGLGILLPLMIGSFLPMLSWDLWSGDLGASGAAGILDDGTTVQMVFLMNALFPAIALMVAMEAMAKHPLEAAGARPERSVKALAKDLAPALAASALCSGLSLTLLAGMWRAMALLIALTVPVGLALMAAGRDTRTRAGGSDHGTEDVLFKTGARMLEGENFESALGRTGRDLGGEPGRLARALSMRCNIAGEEFDCAVDNEAASRTSRNVLEGLKVVREAASKDERGAGLLAMDLASYLKDLRDVEASLKSRLKPTISMMRMTAHVLAPIVLGVTLSIYLSLASVGGEGTDVPVELTFLVLGVFLAQMNAVVAYYVWGIEGRERSGALAHSIGLCLVVSEAIYAATAMVTT